MQMIKAARAILVLSFAFLSNASAQEPVQEQPAEVVRVKTELVQTDVSVVDKHGHFVAGLKADQFELRVDGKPQRLSFFEQVTTGSADEEKQLTAALKGTVAKTNSEENGNQTVQDRGRVVFFFVDDVHLTGDGITRARSVLVHFVEDKMHRNDRVAIVSTSGQIGFLQQLTDNKAVLREAISRLNYKYNPETVASQVTISEVDANLLANHGDRGLFAYLVEATMKEFQFQNAANAVNIVKNRVRQINAQSKLAEIDTLSRLQSLIHSSGPLPGRKLVFFISDGFVVDIKRSNGADIMRNLANEAARMGVVIYTLDTRSNFFGSSVDVSKNDYPDFSPRTAGRTLAESKMPQEPLETLAAETGGQSYLNSNALDEGVADALAETSAYYLLAWRPDTEAQRNGKSRLHVTVQNRPDLRVRMRRRSFDFGANQRTKAARVTIPGSPEDELRAVLGSLYPRQDIPTQVLANYQQTPDKGTLLNVSMQLDSAILSFDEATSKPQAVVDVLGVALDDRGSFASFKQKLDIPREVTVASGGRFIKWSQTLTLPSGLYQVRVAVRDRFSGRTGSAMTWIEIPPAVVK
jgi:VWFA-related protein